MEAVAMRMLGYTRVSTREQGDSGLGLQAQLAKLQTECSQRHWTLVDYAAEVAGFTDAKPALEELLIRVQDRDVDGLMVANLDRLGRTVYRISGIIDAANRQGWSLVCLNPRVDMSDDYGRAMAQMASVFAELERGMIARRTSDALQTKIARGEFVGRPPTIDRRSLELAVHLHERGWAWRRIARRFTEEGRPTPGGAAQWDHQTIAAAVRRYYRFGIEQAANEEVPG